MSKENEVTENQNKKIKYEDLAKIAISREADAALVEVIDRINEDFDLGKINKQDISSYMILEFFKGLKEPDVHKMRMFFFDPVIMLERTLRKAKETGELSDSMKEILFKQFADLSQSARKIKKNSKSDVISDNIKKVEDAA